MMLGGAFKVRNLIYKHISSDNGKLKTRIMEWLRYLKWHQEFDWEELSEFVLFGNNNSKLTVFWENEDFCNPESFTSNTLWTPESRNIADNIRKIVAEVPGFEDLKARLEEEAMFALEDEDAKSASEDTAEAQSSCSFVGTSTRLENSSSIDSEVAFRPDMPYNGANKIAFERHFMRHALWKMSPMKSWKKAPLCSLKTNVKAVKVKSAMKVKYSKSRKQVSRKRAVKTKAKKKSGKRGRSTNKKSRRR